VHSLRPTPIAPTTPEPLFQEPGIRASRALPYELHVHARTNARENQITLTFGNTGEAGAVFHVYDRRHLDRIPRRYTVEAAKTLADDWQLQADGGVYDLWVCGPNGFLREFRGTLPHAIHAVHDVRLEYDKENLSIRLVATGEGHGEATLVVHANAYRHDGPWKLQVPPGQRVVCEWSPIASHRWYDLTVTGEHFEWRFAGRMETGADGCSDPAFL